MTVLPLLASFATSSTLSGSLARRLQRGAELLARLERELRARRELASLGSDILADIGLTRGDIERELARPIWERVDVGALDRQRRRNARSWRAR